jgi:N-acetylglucosaminyldiphosphoundecaprenol N-acetyl-beta-D-mannosaminyltransferase
MRCPAEVGGIVEHVGTADLLGFRVCTGGRSDTLELLWRRLRAGTPTHVITLNPEMVVRSRQNAATHAALAAGDVCVADGVGLSWAAGVLGVRGVERYPGIDLAEDLLARLAACAGRAFLLGARSGVAEQAAARLCAKHPGLSIAGTHDGYFSNAGEVQVVCQIAASAADMLVVGMGSPRQEEFIKANREQLGVPLLLGVGGALEVWSGVRRRAPRWVRRSGMEWAYRAAADLSRLKRIGVLPRFIAIVLAQSLRGAR